MLELTRKPPIDGTVALTVVVPEDRAEAVVRAIKKAAGEAAEEAAGEAVGANFPADAVFPESTPGVVLRGARGLREMTQAELAGLVGAHKSHISGMERGVRPIGKAMARKLGQALDFPWKAFL